MKHHSRPKMQQPAHPAHNMPMPAHDGTALPTGGMAPTGQGMGTPTQMGMQPQPDTSSDWM